jgi:hypothetical protein
MFGVGSGATIAVMAAAADSRIKAIDLLNLWGDWPVWMAKSKVVPENERPGFSKPEFLKKIAGFDPIFLLPQLKTPRIRLSQLNDDFARTPEEAKKKIEAALPSTAESHRFQNNIKFYSTAASDGRGFDWIKQQLKPAEGLPTNAASKKPAARSSTKVYENEGHSFQE